MERRIFLKTAAGAAILNPVISIPTATGTPGSGIRSFSLKPEMKSFIRVENDQIFVETGTLTAVFRNGFLHSLKSKLNGEEFISPFNESEFTALQLAYPNDHIISFNEQSATKIRLNQVSD